MNKNHSKVGHFIILSLLWEYMSNMTIALKKRSNSKDKHFLKDEVMSKLDIPNALKTRQAKMLPFEPNKISDYVIDTVPYHTKMHN